MKTTVFIGTSVDGFIARANGDLDFLPPGGGEHHGYDEFIATVDALSWPQDVPDGSGLRHVAL